MSDNPRLPSEEDNASSIPNYYKTSEASKTDKSISDHKKQPKKWWKNIDQALLSTVALMVISLCALFVSIYQTRVLSSQQEVMAEQQRIMTESAKAQLWPNVEIGLSQGYEEDDRIIKLDLMVANTGTGPAIIQGISMQYNGKYANNWWELFRVAGVPDTTSTEVNNSSISGRVLEAGESYTFLSLTDNQPLMEFFKERILDSNEPHIKVCYKSVFDDYWLLEIEGFNQSYRAVPVDSCVIDSITFVN